eukprot:jgi/Mesen1/2985/ME000176S02021
MEMSKEYTGVLLSFSSIVVKSTNVKILKGLSPYFHLPITAKLLVFAPEPGSILEGEVNAVGHDFIGLLVLGLFNASIPEQNLDGNWFYKEEEEDERGAAKGHWGSYEDGRHVIDIGTHVRFVVASVQTIDGEYMGIQGSLLAPATGDATWLRAHAHDAARTPPSSSARAKAEKQGQEDNGTPVRKEKKEKKKRKRESLGVVPQQGPASAEKPKKKKKRKELPAEEAGEVGARYKDVRLHEEDVPAAVRVEDDESGKEKEKKTKKKKRKAEEVNGVADPGGREAGKVELSSYHGASEEHKENFKVEKVPKNADEGVKEKEKRKKKKKERHQDGDEQTKIEGKKEEKKKDKRRQHDDAADGAAENSKLAGDEATKKQKKKKGGDVADGANGPVGTCASEEKVPRPAVERSIKKMRRKDSL